MNTPDIDSINHVGMAVRRLAETTACYESMGFTLTPYSPHSGALKPGEPVVPLNSGNRCVMFAHNYLEILASADAAQPAPKISNFLKRHQGAHIICFGSEQVESVDDRLREQGIATSGVIPLQREIDTPEGQRTAKFQRVQFAPDDSPEGYIQAARHLTPQYIYQPRYMAHANGCSELSDVILVADDIAHFSEKYRRYTGIAPASEGDARVFRFELASRLTLVHPRHASALLPGSLLPPLPGIAGIVFRCPDLAAQGQRLARGGFTVATVAGRLVVPAEEASGVAVLFEQGT
jgi:catechol 2,3-dioxygenase-like lactoylglutathione lyase family enzyme